jgi:hypothetical protein
VWEGADLRAYEVQWRRFRLRRGCFERVGIGCERPSCIAGDVVGVWMVREGGEEA